IGNEVSDHVTERQNYLYLAHSKLRACSVGPALLVGELPAHIAGASRVLDAAGNVRWEKAFVSGEENMSHTIANLEHHHFKYPLFKRPGDVHVHFFGTATLSFADGVSVAPGETFEIEAPAFGPALRNRLDVFPTEFAKVSTL
ncbi:MAG: FAH family protein, partial [Janthinobacterium sp.]